MADFGVTTALALAGTGLAGVSSFAAAQQQNSANRRAAASAREGAAAQTQQLIDATAAERRKQIVASQQLTGKLRAAASESGGVGGSFEALLQQNALDTLTNDRTIVANYNANGQRIRSGLNADLASISSRNRNTIFDTFMGAAGGAQAGLQLGGLYQSITDSNGTSLNSRSGRAR